MLRSELAKKVAKNLDITQGDANIIVAEVFKILKQTILKRETISIQDFGRFVVKPIKPHLWMDMNTKERYMGRPKYKLKFIPQEEFKDAITEMEVDELDLKELYKNDKDNKGEDDE